MFKLPRIVAWRYTGSDGVSCILTLAQAEARFKHEELYGAARLIGLTPLFERARVADGPMGRVITPTFGVNSI